VSHRIVISSNSLSEGTILADHPSIHGMEARGDLLLPVDAGAALAGGPIGALAYSRHFYGEDGRAFDPARFLRGCPAVVFLANPRTRVEWMARFAQTGAALKGELRLAAEVSSHGMADVSESLARISAPGVMRGSAIVRGSASSFATVCLSGVSSARVLWFALTTIPS